MKSGDECRRNGLYTVLPPISWWGGGTWTSATKGFSDLYAMQQLTTDRATWEIQARLLGQFARHVNRYTGKRYADDPCILAFESINEPLYPKDTPDSPVTAYIDTLTEALRASGTAKPIYYNSWQQRNQAAGASKADGVTCAIYPTGLRSIPLLKVNAPSPWGGVRCHVHVHAPVSGRLVAPNHPAAIWQSHCPYPGSIYFVNSHKSPE
ncbi:MAG: hypothetical protein PHN85_09870 [Kiritimatiellae bacterium]|nr:hypothetical protein [Kiritimatiellia bacterium]